VDDITGKKEQTNLVFNILCGSRLTIDITGLK
jgi:hypothetical protein